MAVNARTELLAGAARPECSAIGVLPERSGGHTLLAQNWDWHPDLRESVVLWTIVEPDGCWLVTMTEAGMLAKIGLNSRGLGLCVNILGSSADGGPGGIPVHVLMRLALQRCDDVAAAGALLEANEVSGSSCFNVGSPGALASYEVSPAGVARIEPEDGVLLHTNHFLEPPGDAEDVHRRDSPSTLARLDELERRVRRAPGQVDAAAVKKACAHTTPGRTRSAATTPRTSATPTARRRSCPSASTSRSRASRSRRARPAARPTARRSRPAGTPPGPQPL